MTTTPIGAPAPAIDQGAPGAASSTGCGDVFLTLVQSILDAEPGLTQPAASQGADPTAVGATSGQPEEPQTDATDPSLTVVTPPSVLAALAAGLPAVVAPAPAVSSEPGTAASTDTPPDATAVSGVTASSSPSGPATTTPGTPVVDARALRAPADRSLATLPAAPATAAEDEPSATTASAPAGTPSATSAAPTSAPAAPTVATVAAPTAVASVGTSAAAPASPVAHQVFPEIVRLTTSTEGPQRVTIRLNPESLGEVRVVLTERRGVLEVSLSANSEARRALLDGTPELQRLLDAVGRGDSRIVVRDGSGLPVTAPAPGSNAPGTSTGQSGSGMSWSGDLSGGAGTSAGRSGAETGPDQGRHPMPGSTTATDGITAATSSQTTTETVTGARSGLDVTM